MAQFHALRLHPGQDLRLALVAWSQDLAVPAACVVTTVGSLQQACLRFAGAETGTQLDGPLEILGLVGTLSEAGVHLHLTVGDRHGQVRGGHLLPGCLIYTTAEVAIATLPHYRFTRPFDPQTGYQELEIIAT